MDATIEHRQTAFRLPVDLMNRLRALAKQENRSLNSLVESILYDAVAHEPNEETKAAIEEARSGKYAGELDADNFEAFMESLKELD